MAETSGWSNRGNHWLSELHQPLSYHDSIKRELHKPLILSGHGVRLVIDKGTLLVRNGFTHHPQTTEEWRFFPKDRKLPSRIVLVDVSGSVTFDVLEWLSAQGVPLVQINWRGEMISVAGGFGYGADLAIMQLQFQKHEGLEAFEFAKWLIRRKIENGIATVTTAFPASPAVEATVQRLTQQIDLIRHDPPTEVSKLLGIEGSAAAAYFQCWHSRPLSWKGTGRQPVPDEWKRIGGRQARRNNNQFARHPVNAMLNYAYTMLENQVRTALLARGFDLTVGFFHAHEPHRPNLIFDMMEPLRPLTDRAILKFVQETIFSPGDFILNSQGVCRLHPQLAANIVRLSQDNQLVQDELETIIREFIGTDETVSIRTRKNEAVTRSRQIGKRG